MESRTRQLQLRLIDDALRDMRRRSRSLARSDVIDFVLDLRRGLLEVADLAWLDADAGPAPQLREAEPRVARRRLLFAHRGSRTAEGRP